MVHGHLPVRPLLFDVPGTRAVLDNESSHARELAPCHLCSRGCSRHACRARLPERAPADGPKGRTPTISCLSRPRVGNWFYAFFIGLDHPGIRRWSPPDTFRSRGCAGHATGKLEPGHLQVSTPSVYSDDEEEYPRYSSAAS